MTKTDPRRASGHASRRRIAPSPGDVEVLLAGPDTLGLTSRAPVSAAVYAKTRKEAQERLHALQGKREAGLFAPAASVAALKRDTLEAFLDHWLQAVVKRSVLPNTWEHYAFADPAGRARKSAIVHGRPGAFAGDGVPMLYRRAFRVGLPTRKRPPPVA